MFETIKSLASQAYDYASELYKSSGLPTSLEDAGIYVGTSKYEDAQRAYSQIVCAPREITREPGVVYASSDDVRTCP